MIRRLLTATTFAAAGFGITDGISARAGDIVPGDFSTNVTIATDYLFRGISQTDEQPAIQGGFDWSHDNGLYAGVWASNVDFDDGDEAHIEIDYYVGYANTVWEALSYDLSFVYYSYPGASSGLNYNYWEVLFGLGYDLGFASLGAGVAVSDNFLGHSGTSVAPSVNAAVPIPLGDDFPLALTLSGEFGHQSIEENGVFGTPDYYWWSIGLGTEIEGFEISVSYTDTDLDTAECFGGSDLCGGRGVVSVSRSF